MWTKCKVTNWLWKYIVMVCIIAQPFAKQFRCGRDVVGLWLQDEFGSTIQSNINFWNLCTSLPANYWRFLFLFGCYMDVHRFLKLFGTLWYQTNACSLKERYLSIILPHRKAKKFPKRKKAIRAPVSTRAIRAIMRRLCFYLFGRVFFTLAFDGWDGLKMSGLLWCFAFFR